MLTSFSDLLGRRRKGSAVGAFTCYDLEAAAAVLAAADDAGTGVILLIGGKVFAAGDGPLLLAALVAVAAAAPAPACVQLDHCDDLELIAAALAGGTGAVMADGSALPYAENAAFVRRAVELAATAGAGVECELGGINGDEDVAVAVAAGALTDPGEAERFMGATGAACLAVSIGNVHGAYRDPPDFDWPRLEEIRARVSQPISLHGASGIPQEMVRRALGAGVAKVNVNTELRHAYLAATADALPGAIPGARLADLHAAQTAAVRAVVRAKLDALGPVAA